MPVCGPFSRFDRPPPAIACDPDGVLSAMRNRRGEPNLRIRLLAGLVALLLLGPAIALAVFKVAATLVGYVI